MHNIKFEYQIIDSLEVRLQKLQELIRLADYHVKLYDQSDEFVTAWKALKEEASE